ncbi:MAG: hypothetical protein IJ773_13715 [Lachnospiraceae bacterium]|nr:hypothetical protein [Lachnospiraceae bacterium]
MEQFWGNLAVMLGALSGFLYGGPRYLQPKKPLYASMIVLGITSLMLGRLYQCVRIAAGFPETDGFQIGMLGVAGASSFFFSSNYSQIDSLVDDGGPAFRRYRRIALLGPLLAILLYLPLAFGPQSVGSKASQAVLTVFLAAAFYFHVKHLLIPDVDYGVVRCLRHFNALALALGGFLMVEMAADAYGNKLLLLAVRMVITALAAAVVPVMDRGVKAWRT